MASARNISEMLTNKGGVLASCRAAAAELAEVDPSWTVTAGV